MSRPKFELSSFKYENLSTRMQRLKQSNSVVNLRSASVDPKINDNNNSKGLNKNASSTILLPNTTIGVNNTNNFLNMLQQQNTLDLTSKYSGRVTKNTGIRKYNQRMLRQVGNINKKTPPKYTLNNTQIIGGVNSSVSPIVYGTQSSQVYLRTKSPVRVAMSSNQFISRSRDHNNLDESSLIDRNRFSRNLETNNSNLSPKYGQKRLRLQPGKIYSRQQLQQYFAY